jgi:uncharacterized protein
MHAPGKSDMRFAKQFKPYHIIIFVILIVIVFVQAGKRVYQAGKANSTQPHSFAQARADHATNLLISKHFPSEPLPPLHSDDLEYTTYEGPLGTMGAIATPVAQSGAMKPAVIWITGGFGGIFEGVDRYSPPEDDQGIASFLDHDIVVYLPALRGEHENPGVFECFYGEVDDIVAAVEHVAKRQDVDPERVFLMGHSIGGTNVLLASLLTDIPAGVVAFGAAPDMRSVVFDGSGYGEEPYDMSDPLEIKLRSPIRFISSIQVPVLYIEGESSLMYATDAKRMENKAKIAGINFHAAIIRGANHVSVLRPSKDLLAHRIESGLIELPSPDEVQQVYTDFYNNPDLKLFDRAQNGSASQVKALLEAGANANASDWENWTPLMIAASENDDPEIITALVEAGARVDELLDDDWTPLMLAVQNNNIPSVIQALLDAGSGVDFKGKYDRTALVYAVKNSGYDIVKILIDSGADINAHGEFGTTPLMMAATDAKTVGVLNLLIDSGANVNAQDSIGNTPLSFAAGWQSEPEYIELLLKSGAQVNARNAYGYSALFSAARRNDNPQISITLINAGEDVNAQSEENFTPLMFAAANTTNPEVLSVLLKAGANAKVQDNTGKIALDYAKENESLKGTDAFKMLEEASK